MNKLSFLPQIITLNQFTCYPLLIISSIFITHSAFCQPTNKLDSIHTSTILSLSDTIAINKLSKLANETTNSDPFLSYQAAKRGLEISLKLNYPKGINNSLRLLGINKLNSGNYDSAFFYFRKALRVAIINNDLIRLGPSYENLGTSFIYSGILDSATHYLQLAVAAYQTINDFKGIGTVYLWIGNVYKEKNDLGNALNYYFLSLDNYSLAKDSSSNGYVYINICSVYRLNYQYEEAIAYGLKSLEFHKARKDFRGLGISLYRLALIYISLNDFNTASVELEEALNIFKELNDRAFIALCLDQLGFCNLSMCNFDDAINNFESSYELAQDIGNRDMEYTSSGHLGSLYRGKGEYEKSLTYLRKALALASELQDQIAIAEILKEILLNYNQINNKDSVETIFHKIDSIQEIIYIEQSQNAMAEVKIKYETDKKVQENNNLHLQNQLQLKENNLLVSQNQIGSLQLTKEKADRLLAENLAEMRLDSISWLTEQQEIQYTLSEQQKLIAKTTEQLNNKRIQNRNLIIGTLSGLTILGSIIALLIIRIRKRKFDQAIKEGQEKVLRAQLKPHFVFNALASIQKYVQENPGLAESYLSKFSQFTQEVLVNSEKNMIPLCDEFSMLTKYMDLQSLRLKNPIEYRFFLAQGLDLDDIMVPPAIFQPLIENSINHNFSQKDGKGLISITCEMQKSMLSCKIEDTCHGAQKHVEIQQARDKERKSFGLNIVRERLELWSKGKQQKCFIDLVPSPDGMSVYLGIPL